MYAEWASDPVVQSLSFDDQRHHAVILCLKCNGTIDRNISDTQRERIVIRGLGLDAATASEVKRRLIEVGLIDVEWQPNGWEKRQYVSDISTQRVRNYRNKNKSENVSETLHETKGKRFGNGPDTEQNRTETTYAPDGAFDRFWKAYPKKKSKGDAKRAWKKIKPDEQLQDRIHRAIERAKTSVDWTKDNGKWVPYPASWLNAEGWEDDVSARPKFGGI